MNLGEQNAVEITTIVHLYFPFKIYFSYLREIK